MNNRDEALLAVKDRYIKEASTDKYATSQDQHLRELEIRAMSKHLSNGLRILDIGCGNGYTIAKLASEFESEFIGIDLSEPMISCAKEITVNLNLKGKAEFRTGNILDLDIDSNSFDVVITERLLINLPTWDDQQKAIRKIHSILKNNGLFLMMDATRQGVDRLNEIRKKVGMEPIPHSTKQNWWINRFDEKQIKNFLQEIFNIENIQRFGMYFFISRVLHPLLVTQHKPKFDSPINQIAEDIALKLGTNYKDLGHSALFVLRKK